MKLRPLVLCLMFSIALTASASAQTPEALLAEGKADAAIAALKLRASGSAVMQAPKPVPITTTVWSYFFPFDIK